ncbi:MAG TPA: hypothetical protein PLI42_02595 [Candidatus Pacearchaeota archaeon]|nr:hypothetical protein [Candidatus Pacearchaeota archaeon]HOS12857.1 hypothetical protein [Candidatus Pacearchaeota archaeon]
MGIGKPTTEKELFSLQDKLFSCYNETEKAEISKQFFNLLFQYTRSLLLQAIKRFSITLPSEIVYDKTIDIVLQVLAKIQEGERVYLSFGGLINLKVLQELFSIKNKRLEKILPLNIKKTSQNDNKEEIDISDIFNLTMNAFGTPVSEKDPLEQINLSEELINSIMTVIESIFDPDVKLSLHDKIILYFGVYHSIINKKNFFKYKEMYILNDKILINAFDIIMQEIYNILTNKEVLLDTKHNNQSHKSTKKVLLNFSNKEE